MAKFSQTDSRRMYSWWWDSHISPKNSKWLQENLTDMDAKVKAMIKLIEEDADSFARRAEMYYKKRPELMKMVEEFYRAYRALAERYDHATGVIRHAHRTMSEAFPNQVPSMFADDSPAGSVSGADARTPETSTSIGESMDGSESVTSHKAMKAFKDPFGHARRELNFDGVEEKENGMHNNQTKRVKDSDSSKSNQETDEIQKLKEALNKLEAEKEAGLLQYQQSLDKLSQLQAEISKTSEDYQVLSDHANKAEKEVTALKEAITKLEAEKKAKLQDYEQCVEKISNLQTGISAAQEDAQKLSERANTAENEVQSMKGELDKFAAEKDEALNKYMQSLETISNLENKLQLTEEDSRRLKERAEKAESEVEVLRQTISKLTEEKDAAAQQYQQCLETISSLENKLAAAEEEAKRLNVEVDNAATKLKSAEEQCLLLERSNQSLHTELEALMLKMGTQTQELSEKQKELGRLWACIQEERLRFVEAETAFQTLQHLHAQTQEELLGVASELQNRTQLLKVKETQNNSLEDEVSKVKQENKHLDEVNASSALSIKDMQSEISSLMEAKGKLQEEVELRLDERNALQQEIYCLKEELNDLNKKHSAILDQVHAVGLDPESLGSSVKELQDEKVRLKEACDRESSDRAALLVKLEQLLEKNSVLDNSVSDLNAELEAVRGKLEALEQSCQALLREKSALDNEKASITEELHETKRNLEKLSENNTVLENSVANAHHQLEVLKAKSKTLEDSCQFLANEKAGLISANDGLTAQLENTNLRLTDLGKLCGELEGRCATLKQENESNLHGVEELEKSLEAERLEHSNYVQMSETRFSGIETEMRLLKEESEYRKIELDQMLDDAIVNEVEIFVLHITAQEMKENNCLLSMKNQKLLDESSLSEKKISQLEQNNIEQQVEIKSLSDQAGRLRAGTYKLLKVLNIVDDYAHGDNAEQEQVYFNQLLSRLQTIKMSLHKLEEENLELTVELSVLLEWIRHIKLESQNLEVEKNIIDNDLKVKIEQVLVLQSEALALHEANEALRSKLREGDCHKEALETQIEDLNQKLMDMQGTCQVLHREKSEMFREKESLMDNILHLEEKNSSLEEENYGLCDKVLALENVSVIFRTFANEKFMAFRELWDDRNKLENQIEDLNWKLMDMQGICQVLQREKLEIFKEKESLMDNILHLEEKNSSLEEENYGLCDKVLALENVSVIFKTFADEKYMVFRKLGDDQNKLENQIEDLNQKLMDMQGTCQVLQREKLEMFKEKDSLMDTILQLEEKQSSLEEENYGLCDKVLALENISLIFRAFADEKFKVFRELEGDRNKLHDMNTALVGKLSSMDGSLEESKTENHHIKEKLQKTEDEMKVITTVKDQLTMEIENGKKLVAEMSLELQKAEEKINLVEKEKLELNESVEDLRNKYDEVKLVCDEQENQILKLSADNDHLSRDGNCLREACQKLEIELCELQDEHDRRRIKEENLHTNLQNKLNEIDELEAQAASVFGQLQHSMASQLLYEQKFHEVHRECLSYMDENEDLKTQLAAYCPEIAALKESISSLENQTDIRIKFQNPENAEVQGAEVANNPREITKEEDNKALKSYTISDLRDLRVRLQAVAKAAVEIKELMVQENTDLHAKLDASTRQLELLQSESARYRRHMRPTSEITEADNALLTKDIVLDQISDSSSYRFSKKEPIDGDNQIIELWETGDPDGAVGLSVSKAKEIISPSAADNTDSRHIKSMKKLKGGLPTSHSLIKEDLRMDSLETSKSSDPIPEGNRRKVLERLDSDIQKLANLQITVQDLKRKLEVTEKSKRGKAVIECEALKGQLEEADIAIIKLFDLNARLTKSIDDRSFSDTKSSSFDQEDSGNARRKKISEQARRMSEKIGRLQLDVQKLQFVLLKMDDEKEARSKMSEARRRILLRDYLYGGRTGQRRKKANFCACIQPSTVEN